MNINKENAQKLWRKRYGNKKSIDDFAGRRMNYDDYNFEKGSIEENSFGWNIHHIMPKSHKVHNDEKNLEIVNIKTNQEAADKTSFVIDKVLYQVKKLKGNSNYGIFKADQRVDFKK